MLVHILDVNDNVPNFTRALYTFRIMENTIATLGFVNVSIVEQFNVCQAVEHFLNVKLLLISSSYSQLSHTNLKHVFQLYIGIIKSNFKYFDVVFQNVMYIVNAQASDKDKGNNSQIQYSLEEGLIW